jgi:hypothetical protein
LAVPVLCNTLETWTLTVFRDEQRPRLAVGRGLNDRRQLSELVGPPDKSQLVRLWLSYHGTSFPPVRDAREALNLRVERRDLKARARCRWGDRIGTTAVKRFLRPV